MLSRALILCLISFSLSAQLDSNRVGFFMVGVNFSGQVPMADLANRFGPNLSAGGSLIYKTKRNFLFSIDGNFMFSQNVKENVIKNMQVTYTNQNGNYSTVVDNEGMPADLRITERGLGIHLMAGKMFKFLSPNENSGFVVMLGAGYLQHKINLYDANQRIAAIRGTMVYGYDRLTNGISFSQFIGYIYLSKSRYTNFYAGFEAFQAITKSVRKFNYDTGLPDTKQRLDILTGFRIGWILPLYKKKPAEFYYY
ncbi:MAG: hypothetical protein JSU07_02390 [Bacteroidetes bacterium]|nr:hypothetical protein [Bacteroidota bacterium]